MEQLRIQLRSVFYKEGNSWISHCLEMDVMGHGRTKETAFRRMIEAALLQIGSSIEHNNRANIFMPADARFFEMYSAGKDITAGEITVQIKKAVANHNNVRIQNLEPREYDCGLAIA